MSSMISLIVPVYDVEKYLPQCLDSIANQTYKDMEVIIINDGSTDGSLKICETYCEKYGWKLISQKNQGLSAARNAGIEVATGDYIAFCDSDDWFDKDMISTMMLKAKTNQADIVECGIRWIYPDNQREEAFTEEKVYGAKDALADYLLQTKTIHSQVCCKVYKRSLFKNIRFAVGKLHEDGFFMYQVMYAAQRYMLTSYVGYNYRQNREGSIMSVNVKPQNIEDVTELMEQRVCFFEQRKEYDLAEMAKAYYFRTTLTNYVTAVTVLKDNVLANKLREKIKINKANILSNRYLGIKKLKFVIFFYMPIIFKLKYMKG